MTEWYKRDDGHGLLGITDGNLIGPEAGRTHAVKQLFVGGQYGSSTGAYLFHVALWTPADYRNEFLAWYEVEHLPILLEAKGWDGCRFVEEHVDEGLLFHALHKLSDRSELESRARKDARSTAWFARLSRNPWFHGGFVRTLYQRTER